MKDVRRYPELILILSWLAYILSYMGRTGYSACLATILNETNITKATAGIVSSSMFFCNAVGQLISSFIVPKLPPAKVILTEVISVSVLNLLFSFEQSIVMMAVLWGLNGFIQSAMLCAIIQLFVTHVSEPYISRGSVLVNTVGSIGGALIYITAWYFTSFYTWRHQFKFLSIVLAVFSFAWFICFKPEIITAYSQEKQEKHFNSVSNYLREMLSSIKDYFPFRIAVPLFFCCFSLGFMRDGMSQWIPVYINENYKVSASFSTLMTFFIPLLQTSGAFLAGSINRHSGRLFGFSFGFYLISFCCMFALNSIKSIGLYYSILLFVVNASSATALITLLISLVPLRYFDKANCVMMVGVLNFCSHIGSFASSYIIGVFSEISGWTGVIILLAGIALLSAAAAYSLNQAQIKGRI